MLKRMLHTDQWKTDIALFGLRVFTGLAMLTAHGWGKWIRLTSGEEIRFADPFHIGATASLAMATFAEVLCSVLLVLGLFHRAAAFFLAFTMATVVFIVKAGDPFGENEKAFMYLTIFVFLILSGPGKISLDQYFFNRSK